MTEKKLDLRLNETNESARNKHYEPVRLWKKIRMNEGTFIFLLFIISLSIVVGKVYVNYGNILRPRYTYITSTMSTFLNVFDIFNLSPISDVSELNVKQLTATSEKFVNISRYDDVVANVTTSFFKTYGWLIRAMICGLIMMGFTWFIIYKDSSIPGIDPPSPFSFSKQQLSKVSGVQMNYLVGILNGILIFIYMCL